MTDNPTTNDIAKRNFRTTIEVGVIVTVGMAVATGGLLLIDHFIRSAFA